MPLIYEYNDQHIMPHSDNHLYYEYDNQDLQYQMKHIQIHHTESLITSLILSALFDRN